MKNRHELVQIKTFEGDSELNMIQGVPIYCIHRTAKDKYIEESMKQLVEKNILRNDILKLVNEHKNKEAYIKRSKRNMKDFEDETIEHKKKLNDKVQINCSTSKFNKNCYGDN